MKDFEGMNNDIHAALQTLDKQHESDIADDLPRHEARVKLARLQGKLIGASERLRKFLGKLKDVPNE